LLGLAVMCWRVRQRAGEQGESAFAQAAQRAQQGVAGAGADIEFPPAGRLPDRDMDAGAVVARVGEGGQPGCGDGVQHGQGVAAGGGDVVHRARFRLQDPHREPAGCQYRLDVAAVSVSLAGVPEVNDLALGAEGRLLAPVDGDDGAIVGAPLFNTFRYQADVPRE
jgi:hypothetical protein